MTRDEINRKISELMEPLDTLPEHKSYGGTPSPKLAWYHLHCKEEQEDGSVIDVDEWRPRNWHADMNWPTLLREMPAFNMLDARRICDAYQCNAEMFVTEPILAPTIEEAVCLSWLKWKEAIEQLSDPREPDSDRG